MFNNITKENATIRNQDTMEENTVADEESMSILKVIEKKKNSHGQ